MEDGGAMIAGWTGPRGERPFEVEGLNAFLAPMDPSGEMRVYIISAEGSQIPVGVFRDSTSTSYLASTHPGGRRFGHFLGTGISQIRERGAGPGAPQAVI